MFVNDARGTTGIIFFVEIGEVRVSSVTCFAEDRLQRKIDITESTFGGYGNTANAELWSNPNDLNYLAFNFFRKLAIIFPYMIFSFLRKRSCILPMSHWRCSRWHSIVKIVAVVVIGMSWVRSILFGSIFVHRTKCLSSRPNSKEIHVIKTKSNFVNFYSCHFGSSMMQLANQQTRKTANVCTCRTQRECAF